MFPFVLYFVTGIITGYHVYTLLALAVYGAPFNPLELVALLGSFSLLIAAYVSLFRPHAAARIALLALLAVWCFYAPAIAKVIRTRLAADSVAANHCLNSSTATIACLAPEFVKMSRRGPWGRETALS